MDTQALRDEHRSIMTMASRLGGIAGDIKTRGDAFDACTLIRTIDDLLGGHLAVEDENLYPALMAAEDEETRLLGADAFEEMGGIVGAWVNYRDHWTADVILAEPGRFAVSTSGLISALSLRIEMENDLLYPAMERLSGAGNCAAA